MGFVQKYEQQEVERLLKNSESDGGHAEARHTVAAVGHQRKATTREELANRVVGTRTDRAGAFSVAGDQSWAVRAALNSDTGQQALAILNRSDVTRVATKIRLPAQHAPYGHMAVAQVEFELPFQGAPTAAMSEQVVVGTMLVLEKRYNCMLHIVTAYPLDTIAIETTQATMTNGTLVNIQP